MNLSIKLGDKRVDMPMEFSYPQWLRLKTFGEDLNAINLLSICSGIDVKELKKADLKDVEDIANVLSKFYFSATPSSEIVLTFFHNDVEYGLQKDFSKLKYGAWVDLEVYSAEDVDKNIPKILSLLYYPIKQWNGKKYILEEYSDEVVNASAESFQDIPIRIWHGAASFFFLFAERYIANMQSSLNTKIKLQKMYQMGKKILPKFLQKKLPEGFISGDSKF